MDSNETVEELKIRKTTRNRCYFTLLKTLNWSLTRRTKSQWMGGKKKGSGWYYYHDREEFSAGSRVRWANKVNEEPSPWRICTKNMINLIWSWLWPYVQSIHFKTLGLRIGVVENMEEKDSGRDYRTRWRTSWKGWELEDDECLAWKEMKGGFN